MFVAEQSTIDEEEENFFSKLKLTRFIFFSFSPFSNERKSSEVVSIASSNIRARIAGYEIVEKANDKHVVYKIRVEDVGRWRMDAFFGRVPVWHIFRRYSDFLRLSRQLSTSSLKLPPRRFVFGNFEPTFLGRRIRDLQAFLDNVLSYFGESDDNVCDFFCLESPPLSSDWSEGGNPRAAYDAMEQVVSELRAQLRSRESLESTLSDQRRRLREQEAQVEKLRGEVDALRKQKDGLLRALDDEHHEGIISN